MGETQPKKKGIEYRVILPRSIKCFFVVVVLSLYLKEDPDEKGTVRGMEVTSTG